MALSRKPHRRRETTYPGCAMAADVRDAHTATLLVATPSLTANGRASAYLYLAGSSLGGPTARGSRIARQINCAGNVQKPLEQVRSPLVADAEEVAAEQPGKRALGHPAETPQPLAEVDPAAGDPRYQRVDGDQGLHLTPGPNLSPS